MNWLDYTLIVILAVGLAAGLRIGILGAIYYTVMAFLSWLVAAQFGSLVGRLFEVFLDDGQMVTVVSFAVVIALVLYVARMLWPFVRTALGIGTLGISSVVDRAGGLVVGLVLGVALSGALVVGMVRLTYDFTGDNSLSAVASVREGFETALTESTVVPIFVQTADALPGGSLGFVPGDFQRALDILRDRMG